jgi:proteasome assembly chaperone (PAC2) family protein
VHGGVRALGAVTVAVQMQSVAVEAQPLDTRSEQVERFVALLELREEPVVAEDLRPDE